MNKNIFKLTLVFLLGITISLLLGGTTTNNNPKYQIVAGGWYSEIFILNTHTGKLFRYYFYIDGVASDRVEKICVESFGVPDKPEYQLLKKMECEVWKSKELFKDK